MISDTLAYFESRRKLIDGALASLVPPPGPKRDSMERIAEFCGRGKMIRGCLVFLGSEVAREAALASGARTAGAALPEAPGDDIILAAAAMELFQAGLLAHDDIMDRDELRRGSPTVHARYAKESEARAAGGPGPISPAEALHIGESLAICLGDLCYFEAFSALSRGLAGNSRHDEIVGLAASVLGEVAIAQMADVSWGSGGAEVPENEILAMYRGKTAHYSFSMPLAVGALTAAGGGAPGGSGDIVGPLYELGEELGILFQIRDDELGLFGASESTGKAAGSDLREGKKTLFRARMLAAAPTSERTRLAELFGGGVEASEADIAYIRRLSEELGVARSIALMSRKAEDAAAAILDALPGISPRTRAVLGGLVEYVTKREK
jgi:geranylgeranyl diphosphate synthase, type I